MDKCYWREIEARNLGEDIQFKCRCNIDDETCKALKLFLRDKYDFVYIITEYPNEDGTYREQYDFTVDSNNPKAIVAGWLMFRDR